MSLYPYLKNETFRSAIAILQTMYAEKPRIKIFWFPLFSIYQI